MVYRNKRMLIPGATGLVLTLLFVSQYLGSGRRPVDQLQQGFSEVPSKIRPTLMVETVSPQREDLLRQITVPGTLKPFQTTTLYSKVAGYLAWITVDIGDRVKKGEVIAKIEVPEMSSEYDAAQAEVDGARADYGHAQAERERAQAIYHLKKISYQRLERIRQEEPEMMPQQRVDEAKAEFQVADADLRVIGSRLRQTKSQIKRSEANLSRLETFIAYSEIKVPFSGVITKRFVHPGAFIQLASTSQNARPVVTVAKINVLRVSVAVPELEVPFVQEGDQATITLTALPNRKFVGKVTRFAIALNPSTRTMETEIDIANPGRRLHPGMYGQVTLELEKHADAITLPARALHGGDESFVYCVTDGVVRKVEVATGLDDGIKVEITSGLVGNERVILVVKGSIAEGMPVEFESSGG